MNTPPANDWLNRFPELDALSGDDRRYLADHAHIAALPAGRTVFAPGKKPGGFMLLAKGVVRVQQAGAGGREIVLYRGAAGESCIMTTSCLISGEDFMAEGFTATPAVALFVPKDSFDALMGRSAVFRQLVFTRYMARMSDLQKLVEDIAFTRMDRRLAQKLLALAPDGGAGPA